MIKIRGRQQGKKFLWGLRRHRYDLVDGSEKQTNRIFVGKVLAIKVIMDYTTTAADKFRTKL